jgi:hypothetical protein
MFLYTRIALNKGARHKASGHLGVGMPLPLARCLPLAPSLAPSLALTVLKAVSNT